jgi:DNA modification methylase
MQEFLDKIICGDCIELLSKAGEPFADLIFADPPFNIGYKYDKYYDKLKKKNYIAWTKEWMSICKQVLKPHGSFHIAIGDDYAANVKIIANELGLFIRNWIIRYYTFGQQMKNKFARAHTHIFYFVNNKKNFIFNDHAVRIPSDRQLLYNDRRANPSGKIPDDVWDGYPRVCGTFKERTGWHPCQMPESLLKRIIAASSNPGDCVLDPFCGSGTSAVAAYQLNRHFIGIDISPQYVENAKKRLVELKKSRSETLFPDAMELNEIIQLSADMRKPLKEIAKDKKLMKLFMNQFSMQVNGRKKYSGQQIVTAIKDLAGCTQESSCPEVSS